MDILYHYHTRLALAFKINCKGPVRDIFIFWLNNFIIHRIHHENGHKIKITGRERQFSCKLRYHPQTEHVVRSCNRVQEWRYVHSRTSTSEHKRSPCSDQAIAKISFFWIVALPLPRGLKPSAGDECKLVFLCVVGRGGI